LDGLEFRALQARELINISLEFYDDELQHRTELGKLKIWEPIFSMDYASDNTIIHAEGSITVHPPRRSPGGHSDYRTQERNREREI
jgi:hypothetical protein